MAVNKTLNVEQGADFKTRILVESEGTPIDFVGGGYSARLEVKPAYTDPRQILCLQTATGSPLGNGSIVFHEGGVTGRITLNITAAESAAVLIQGESVDYVYDLEIENASGFVTRLYDGDFIISKNITTTC